jgi:elongator complex protein 2
MPSNREVALPVDTAHSLTVSHIAFSANGRCLLTCSRDRSWRLYRVPETSDRPDFGFELLAVSDKAHTRIVYDCCFLAGHDDTFATASRDKTVR